MSNETDLDWIIRETSGEWLDGDTVIARAGDMVLSAERCGQVDDGCRWFSKAEYLTRKAELQSKPSWSGSPEWAQFLIQTMAGRWLWLSRKPKGMDCEGIMYFHSDAKSEKSTDGTVLGDWRDTLEKRPYFSATNCTVTSSGSFGVIVGEASELSEQAMTLSQQEAPEFKPSIEEANRLTQEFKPFTSIEDNQGQDMKQDNGWFERGELPPVGPRCVALLGIAPKANCEVIAKTEQQMVVKWEENGMMDVIDLDVHVAFRPIRTERDELIEIIASNLSGTSGQVADAILAAGFKLEAK